MMRRWVYLLLIVVLLDGCAPARQTEIVSSPASEWPTHGWRISAPIEQGMNPEKLDRLAGVVEQKGINLHSLLIIRNGAIVYEKYFGSNHKDTPHILYSVTKSFTSTLVGIAIDQGMLNGVEERVVDLLPDRSFDQLSVEKQAMTLEDLLTMTSGLAWEEGDPSIQSLYRSEDWVSALMDLPMNSEPGSIFNYCSGCSHVLNGILAQALGADVGKFANKYLFEPLGITQYHWEADRQGIPIGGWGLYLTSRDMAKLGYLFLNKGQWDGKEVVSADWVEKATTGRVINGLATGYGYQWWVYPDKGAYAAVGRAGQTIYMVPALNLIIVTTADIPAGHDSIFDLIDHDILPAVE